MLRSHSFLARPVIAHPPQVEHHRWTQPERHPSAHGLRPLDAPTLAKLRDMRWRSAPHNPRRTWLAMMAVLSLHVLFAVALWHIMRPLPGRPVAEPVEQVLRMRFISREPTASIKAPPAPPAPPPIRRRAPVTTHEPAAKDAMRLQPPPAVPTETAHPALFDKQGRPLLPGSVATSAAPDYVQHQPQDNSGIMQHTDPVKYKATRFEQYFPSADETAGGAAVRHVIDKVVNSTAVNLPHGVHLKCTTILGIPIPNCINPPAPPSAKDGDERLSMAPAQPLDGMAHAPKPPTEKACIALYRAGKPLAWGCPIDTPNRAVDAELSQRNQRPAGPP
ncbi:MAG: hypothetical protein M3Y93_03595 [Pseudomonadota bacterium]|nr:hypothetical protein [Pseudomonadota bacterium]